MSVESTAPAPAGSIRSRIAAHPVAAFLLLAIPLGLLHGSMNASQSMDTVDWWQFIPAVVVLTPAVAAYLAVRSPTTGQGSSGHALRRRRIRPVRPANP